MGGRGRTPFSFRILLRVFLTISTSYRTAILFYVLYSDLFHINKYTYWNYTLFWLFEVLYLFATFIEGYFIKYLTIWAYPIVYGSNFLVFAVIIVVIQLNGWLFVEATEFGTGTYKIGDIHTGDYFVHVLPVIETYFALIYGLFFYVRAILGDFRYNLHNTGRIFYFFYFIFSPLLPLSVYSIFFNPVVEYPTGLSWITGTCIVFLLSTLYMICTYSIFIAGTDIHIYVGPYNPRPTPRDAKLHC